MAKADPKTIGARGLTDPTRIIILVAFYFIGGYFGNQISFLGGKEALIWPPSGIALAAIILLGYHFWPGVALGAILFSFIKGQPPVFFTLGSAIGNTIGAILCAYLLERLIHFDKSFRQVKDAIGFIIFACLIGTTVNALFNVIGNIYQEKQWHIIRDFDPELLNLVLKWWVPNAMGALVITPLILAWISPIKKSKLKKRQLFEGLACGILLILSCFIAFSASVDSTNYPFAYLPYPFLIWGALRFGLLGATTGTFIVSVSSIYALRSNIGPFNFGDSNTSLMVIGSYIGVLAVSNLILAAATTESETAQQEVIKNQQLYRAVVEDQTDMISRFRADGTVTFANEAFCRFHGVSSEELIGKKTPMLTGSSSQEHMLRIASFSHQKPEVTYDYPIMSPSGSVLWHQCILRQLVDESGQMFEYQSVEQDITQRKRAEEALRKSEEMFNLISQNVDDLIAVTDTEGRRVFNNPSYSKIFGEHENLKGTDSFEQIHPEDKDNVKLVFRETIETGVGKRLEYRFLLPDGSIHYVDSVGNFVPGDPGKLGYLVTIGRDITERKRIEEDLARARDAALIAAKQKAEFLANMSHEIRTPLNGVIGLTNLLMRSPLANQQQEYVEKIRSCSDALMSIINDVLDFSKIEAGKLQMETIDFSLLHAIETSIELFVQKAQDKRIELASYLDDGVPIRVRGDLGHIRQVIVNLVGNAVKFTEQGEVVLRVVKVSETEKDLIVRFEVKDTGIGIPSEVQPNLFMSFSQADGSTTRKYGGTGLGLAICRQLVTLMGGQIGLESTPGNGSLFWFTLPLQKQNVATEKPMQFKDIRVLLVDCNRTMLDILQKQFATWKMSVEVTDSGPQFLEKMRHQSAKGNPFHMVILDTEMQQKESIALAYSLKNDPALSMTKVILICSFGSNLDTQELLSCGIDRILDKPIKQSELFDSMAYLLGHQKSEQKPKDTISKKVQNEHKSSSHDLKILLAEDNSINQLVALSELKDLGYTADAVADGLEVLEAIERVPYDLILMDCQMPNMDGYETTRKIREKEKNGLVCWSVPITIIAMTAHALEGDREKCLQAGMNDYLTKPVEQNMLLLALERWSGAQKPTASQAVISTPTPPPVAPTHIFSQAIESEKTLSPQTVPVDLNRLQRITHGNTNKIKDLIVLYLKQTSGLCQQIEDAMAKGATKEVEQYAHKICGSSANCGVQDMVQLFRDMEHLAREGKFDALKAPWQAASREFERVKEYLQNEMANMS